MNLPKIDYPIHNITIPSLKKPHKFRPFLVKEEKILLMAKESDNISDYLSAMKQVVNNCCLTPKFNINSLTAFDIEYLFLKLRAVSVDNMVKLSYIDTEDNQSYDFEIDLNKIEIKFPDNLDNNIKITDKMGIIMKYPSADLYDDKDLIDKTSEPLFDLMIKCVERIYDGDSVYDVRNNKKEEISEFLESLDIKTFEKMSNFLTDTPRLYHLIEYKNSLGNDRKIELSSLNDFFP
jgi:hypothetical protein